MAPGTLKGLLATGLLLGLSGISTAAHAAPSPDSGPTTGGTVVTFTAPAGVTFTQLAAGYNHSLAVGDDGNAYAWGMNYSGQLGTDTGGAPVWVPTFG